MEKCGCSQCIQLFGTKAMDVQGHIIENCPCKNCLVKTMCIIACDDVIYYCKTFEKGYKGK